MRKLVMIAILISGCDSGKQPRLEGPPAAPPAGPPTSTLGRSGTFYQVQLRGFLARATWAAEDAHGDCEKLAIGLEALRPEVRDLVQSFGLDDDTKPHPLGEPLQSRWNDQQTFFADCLPKNTRYSNAYDQTLRAIDIGTEEIAARTDAMRKHQAAEQQKLEAEAVEGPAGPPDPSKFKDRYALPVKFAVSKSRSNPNAIDHLGPRQVVRDFRSRALARRND